MILSFRSKAPERFWWKGAVKRVDPRHIKKLRIILVALEEVVALDDMDKAGLHFHQLVGDQSGRFSVRVDRNWRVTFGWSEAGLDAIDVDYEDYH